LTRSALCALLVLPPLLVASAGCSDSFLADAGLDGSTDLGMDGGPRDLGRDTGPPDFGLRDLGTYDGPEDCSEIAGYRRCDERCARPCDSPQRCVEEIGLCRIPAGGCAFTALTEDYRTYCVQGGPCLVYDGDGTVADPWIGSCFDADVCLASEGAGLPEFTCRYSDGSVVVTGPPAGTCPPSSEGAPFCGGACGMAPEGCPNTDSIITPGTNTANPCIGLSDSRAFGVCTYWNLECATVGTRFGLEQLAFVHDVCRENYGAPCACMQIEAGPDGPMSYFVKADACLRYRAAYPDSVECLDVTEMPIR